MVMVVWPFWYRNPDAGQIEQAWTQSTGFVGRDVNDV